MREKLPAPATQADEYLHDIALSLRQIKDALAQIATANDAEDVTVMEEDLILTPLREKAPAKRRKQ